MQHTAAELEEMFGVTNEQLETWEEGLSKGVLPGEPAGPVLVGRPLLLGEEMRSVTYKDTATVIEVMDRRAESLGLSRSSYLRNLVRKDLANAEVA